MSELFFQWDLQAFIRINSEYTNYFLDIMCPLFRNKYFWIPLYIFLISFLIINFKKKGLVIILFLIVTIFIADKLSSEVIKPYVHRLRPCNEPYLKDYVRLLVNCGSGYSFPSSHATNHFAVAFFFVVLFIQKWKWVLPIGFFWAFAISYSQVYVGVHYPVDIIGGALLGVAVGTGVGIVPLKLLDLNRQTTLLP